MPVAVIGTKLDLLAAGHTINQTSRLAHELCADELLVDGRHALAAGSTNGVKLARFFDRVIEHEQRQQLADSGGGRASHGMLERRRRLLYA
jgi:hypothetical protein